MFMELEASDRDQVGYACSAQNSKLLPPQRRKTTNNVKTVKTSVSKYFTEYHKQRAEKAQ